MRTIQLTLDDELVTALDQAVQSLKTSRFSFIEKALKEALENFDVQHFEQIHRQGYLNHPVEPGEFINYEAETLTQES